MPDIDIDLEEWDDDPQRPRNRREQWTELVLAEHTQREWSAITAAIGTTDTTVHNGQTARGSEQWCTLALSAASHPAVSPAAPAAKTVAPPRFTVDEDLVRTWLSAPAPVTLDPDGTVADRLGLLDWWQASDIDAHKAATTLLTNAQHAGIFAVAGHHVAVLRVVDGFDDESSYLLAVLRDQGPALLCDDQEAGHLIPYTARTPVDGAIHLLTTVARLANATLDELADPVPAPTFPGRHGAAR